MTATHSKKKRKWPFILLSIVIVLIIVVGISVGYEYSKLKPANHFKTVKTISSVPASSNSNDTSNNLTKNVPQETGTMNILLLGSDERQSHSAGHSDTIMVMHVDFNKNTISTVSIPRDTRVYLKGYGYTKLTSVQYITQATKGQTTGMQAAATAISGLTGVPINYYVETNYAGLQQMVNTLGGSLTIDVPFDVKISHPWYKEDKGMVIKKGTQILTSKQIFEMVHERYSLARGDYDRQLLQEKVLVAIAKEGSKPSNLTKLPSLIKQKNNFLIGTNMSDSDLLSFGITLKNIAPDKAQYYQINGTGKTMYDDILKNNNSEIVLNPSSIKSVMAHFQ